MANGRKLGLNRMRQQQHGLVNSGMTGCKQALLWLSLLHQVQLHMQIPQLELLKLRSN